MARKPSILDIHQLEHRTVSLRNRLRFHLGPKGEPDGRRYFVIGHPRTGTQTLHRVFKANDIPSFHSSRSWRLADYTAFSDRGNYQPVRQLDHYYRDALFVLNTRPAYTYIRSRMNHMKKNRGPRHLPGASFTVRNIRNELLLRNRYFMEMIRYFDQRDDFSIVNIEKPGALAFFCERLGLEYPGDFISNHSGRWVLTEEELGRIDRAMEELGIEDDAMNPFIFPHLLDEPDRAFLTRFMERTDPRIHL
ncbi:MAG: hypothetical protein R6U87_09190 [Thiohalospira sp.]